MVNYACGFNQSETGKYFKWMIIFIIIWPVRPREQFPWKTIRKKVPYEGRTRPSDRAGKTRTALLESVTTKSMRVNDKNNFVAAKVYSLQMSHESEHSESEFYYPGELSHAQLLHTVAN